MHNTKPLYPETGTVCVTGEVKPLVQAEDRPGSVDLDLEALLQIVTPNAAVTLDFSCFVWARDEESKAAERDRITRELGAVNTLVAEVLTFQRAFHEQAAKALEILE